MGSRSEKGDLRKDSGEVPRYEWEAYRDTNGRRTAIQIGGVLRVCPFSHSQCHRKHCDTNWRCIAMQTGGASTFLKGSGGGWGYDIALRQTL